MRWLSLGLVVALARVASAQPGAAPAGPCPQADGYRSAIALHKSWQAKACVEGGDDCDDEKRAVATLSELAVRCDAGEAVGPPPTQFPRTEAPGSPEAGGRFDAVFEGVGGGGLALGNSSWRSSVGLSPSLAARAGAMRGDLGVLVSGEWTAGQLSDTNGIVPTPNNSQALRRYRFLADLVWERSPIPNLAIGARAGIGADYVDARVNRATSGGAPVTYDESDLGLALEVGAAAWWRAGAGTDVGATLMMPVAKHDASASMVTFSYTSLDLELLVGVRVSSRR